MEVIINVFKGIQKLLTPPRAFSWQTLIWLSIFSWIMSSLSTEPVQNILAFMGWIFLITGVNWATIVNPPKIAGFSVGPWFTGALVCIFIFGNWTEGRSSIALIFWPPISAIIACIPDFFAPGLKFRFPPLSVRPRIVILLASNLLISCWLQFYFVLQSWVEQYPTLLLLDNLQKSAFLVRIGTPSELEPRGKLILNSLEPKLRDQLNNRAWPDVERWLINKKITLEVIRKQAQKELKPQEEDFWWVLKYEVSSAGSGYNLKLRSVWQGPRPKQGEYYLEKVCQIRQVPRRANTKSSGETTEAGELYVGQVKCNPVSDLLFISTRNRG